MLNIICENNKRICKLFQYFRGRSSNYVSTEMDASVPTTTGIENGKSH